MACLVGLATAFGTALKRGARVVIAREAGATVTEIEGLADGSATVVVAAPGLEGPLVELLKASASN